MMQSIQRDYWSKIWCAALLLALCALLVDGVPARAQSSGYRVAILTPGLGFNTALDGFREGLAQLGYTEGKNITFIIEDVQGDIEGLANRATKLVAAKPDLLFTLATAPTAAARKATATLPILFAFVADPLRSGLVASHASSQNNLTGIANHAGTLSGKRLEILKEIMPGVTRVLALVAPRENVSVTSFEDLVALAPKLGIELVRRDVTTREDIVQILNTLPTGSVDAIFHVPSSLVGAHIDLLSQKAREDGLPLVSHEGSAVERGALLAYGADFRLLGKQAAKLAVKIMQGAKPSEMPIQTPENLLLAINLTTARAIGLTIPRQVLDIADRLVE